MLSSISLGLTLDISINVLERYIQESSLGPRLLLSHARQSVEPSREVTGQSRGRESGCGGVRNQLPESCSTDLDNSKHQPEDNPGDPSESQQSEAKSTEAEAEQSCRFEVQ